MNIIRTLFPDTVYDTTAYMIGGLSGVGYSEVIPAAIVILASLIIAFFLSPKIDILTLGDESARSIGLNTDLMRFILLILASLLAGAAVSYAGLIGFVGLIAPHVMRRIIGGRHTALLPASALFGGALLLFSDLIARLVFSPYEIPVGIILSLIGGPFFIFLLFFGRRSGYDNM